ncbi:hypothetical protein SAMN05216532_8359 [Streptomyces sp. 2231.1]|nr:hypothetical protein SAMN05216532_8359 [Streptomyces sp. 2231.1]
MYFAKSVLAGPRDTVVAPTPRERPVSGYDVRGSSADLRGSPHVGLGRHLAQLGQLRVARNREVAQRWWSEAIFDSATDSTAVRCPGSTPACTPAACSPLRETAW